MSGSKVELSVDQKIATGSFGSPVSVHGARMQSFSRDLLPVHGGHPRTTTVAVSGFLVGVIEGQVQGRAGPSFAQETAMGSNGPECRSGDKVTIPKPVAGARLPPRAECHNSANLRRAHGSDGQEELRSNGPCRYPSRSRQYSLPLERQPAAPLRTRTDSEDRRRPTSPRARCGS